MTKRWFVLLCAAGLWLLGGSGLWAASIPGLFNTGVDAAGNPLVGGSGVADPHYMILSGPGANIYPLSAVTFNCCYFSDQPSGTNGNSRWISVNTGGTNSGSGTYVFETTFDLSGLNPATASISGRFAADNHVSATEINGNTVAGATTDTFSNYTNFTVPVGSGFVAGLNTLDFFVKDDGAPMSLRVDSLAGTADVIQVGNVPEPGTVALLSCGLALLALRRRRPSN